MSSVDEMDASGSSSAGSLAIEPPFRDTQPGGCLPPKAARHRLGHSLISMTMNTYAHFLDAEDIVVAEAMDGILKPKAK